MLYNCASFWIITKICHDIYCILFQLKDLFRFLFIAVFVVLGVGIYYHANLWPDHQTMFSGDWTNWRIWTIIYYPYWQLYAELNLESLDGKITSISYMFSILFSIHWNWIFFNIDIYILAALRYLVGEKCILYRECCLN